jgi:hypothetical protein
LNQDFPAQSDAHEFAVEYAASQRKFGAGNALNGVSIVSMEDNYG